MQRNLGLPRKGRLRRVSLIQPTLLPFYLSENLFERGNPGQRLFFRSPLPEIEQLIPMS